VRTFTVVWFFGSNHGMYYTQAESKYAAVVDTLRLFSDDFRKRARVMVFEGGPALDVFDIEQWLKHVNGGDPEEEDEALSRV
jgi:hypothetical protein